MYIYISILTRMPFPLFKRTKKKSLFTIGFYNLENLFDTKDDPHTLDDDFTAEGRKNWTKKRYRKKIFKLGKTIAKIGKKGSGSSPVILGVAEVENKRVLKDLLKSPQLSKLNYEFIHFESPDERGIDTALLYNPDYFNKLQAETIPLILIDDEGIRDRTRDILYVHGKLNNEEIHLFVNHWPSRRAGEDLTEYKRIAAAEKIMEYMELIESKYEAPNYIIMGDFNDGPHSNSIKNLVARKELYNPMEKLLTPERGSANYRRTWSLFDQILVSHSFFNYQEGTHSFAHANIFDEYFLTEWKGKYQGNPFRTYVGKKYKGGYSDHFPVYIQLQFNK